MVKSINSNIFFGLLFWRFCIFEKMKIVLFVVTASAIISFADAAAVAPVMVEHDEPHHEGQDQHETEAHQSQGKNVWCLNKTKRLILLDIFRARQEFMLQMMTEANSMK